MEAQLHLTKLGLDNRSMILNPADKGLSQQLLKNGLREPMNSYFLSKFIRDKKPDILDVGGNIGYFPLLELLSNAKTVTVYEPVQETFSYLVKNISDFENAKCFNLGLSDKAEECEIFIPTHRNLASINPNNNYLEMNKIEMATRQQVKLVTLKDACLEIESDNILCRMDTEGYETTILREIPDKIKYLSFEFHTKILGQKASVNFLNHIENSGFKVFLMLRELEGLNRLFRRFGFTVFKIYNKIKEKRIYEDPTRNELLKVISIERENPHIFATRM